MKSVHLFWFVFLVLISTGCGDDDTFKDEVVDVLREQELAHAEEALEKEPVTVTDTTSSRSAGGKHDFYSEGDYWWPDPDDPDGPYIQRDGETNPDNFVAHRHAMIRLSEIVGSLASAYEITGEEHYVEHAMKHLEAWFADSTTMMNPSLEYAQAIKGRVTGRGIGIIDTIHLIEVAQGVRTIEEASVVDPQLLSEIKGWFSEYLDWLMNHEYSMDEMEAENNHGTCWVMQVGAFAKLTGDEEILQFCRDRYKEVLLPNQMAEDGSFPRELNRTKPYGYSLFNLDAMVMVAHILSDENENLWTYETEGKDVRQGIEFLYPYVEDKDKWPYDEDVMYWEDWPVAHPFLIFGAHAYEVQEWLETWKGLEHDPEVDEVIRNLPIRHPIIWL